MSGVHRAPRRLAGILLVVLLAGCSQGDATAMIDGGDRGVALLGDVVVRAAPETTLTIEHAGAPPAEGDESPVTHALVGAAEGSLPPLFVPAGGGLIPNPAVWGQCRGGEAVSATGRCPVPPAEGPAAWDGSAYWSTGAMLPGEQREVPLAAELAEESTLVCAIHPELRVLVRTSGESSPRATASERVTTALEAGQTLPPDNVVLAGQTVDDAYVGRFVPATMTVRVGGTVTWRAQPRAPVDVVFNGGDLDLTHTGPGDGLPAGDAQGWNGRGELRSGFLSGDASAGASASSWSVTFLRAGRYSYASRFGAQLRGTIVVRNP